MSSFTESTEKLESHQKQKKERGTRFKKTSCFRLAGDFKRFQSKKPFVEYEGK